MSTVDVDELTNNKRLGRKERRPKIQIELTPEAEEELDELQRLSNSTTRVDTIRRALLFYSWFIHDVDADSTIQVQKDGKTVQSFPASLLKGAKKTS